MSRRDEFLAGLKILEDESSPKRCPHVALTDICYGCLTTLAEETFSQVSPDRIIGERFMVRDGKLIKISNGEEVPIDEPLFLLRARDHLAIGTLLEFQNLAVADGCNDFLLNMLQKTIAEFQEFAFQNPEKMKQPGITRGL